MQLACWRKPLPQRTALLILVVGSALIWMAVWQVTMAQVRDERFRVMVQLLADEPAGSEATRKDVLPKMTLCIENRCGRDLRLYAYDGKYPDRIIVSKDGKSFTLWHRSLRRVGMHVTPGFTVTDLMPGASHSYKLDLTGEFVTDSIEFTNRAWLFLTDDWTGYTITAKVAVDRIVVFSNPVTIGSGPTVAQMK